MGLSKVRPSLLPQVSDMAAPAFDSQFWAIAIKMEEDESSLKMKTEQLCAVHDFNVPADGLRVGTLDSLMSLSDDLVKLDMLSESTVMKIYRQLSELKGEEPTINGGAHTLSLLRH